jgi:hypothetical protein
MEHADGARQTQIEPETTPLSETPSLASHKAIMGNFCTHGERDYNFLIAFSKSLTVALSRGRRKVEVVDVSYPDPRRS